MAIQYTKSITSMSTEDEGDNTDVVKSAVYNITATEGNKSFASMKTIPLGDVSDDYASYDALTEDVVIGWCEAVMGSSEVVALKRGLEVQFTTPFTIGVPQEKQLPW